tara:strand:- start:2637 stop:2942 length:306 start_codon:yes stop_codon:yes gene_type:complete
MSEFGIILVLMVCCFLLGVISTHMVYANKCPISLFGRTLAMDDRRTALMNDGVLGQASQSGEVMTRGVSSVHTPVAASQSIAVQPVPHMQPSMSSSLQTNI